MNSDHLLPSAIVCSCGKRFSSSSGSDHRPSSNRRLPVANDSSALWLFLRHHVARVASRSGARQTHRAANVFVRCFFCSVKKIVADPHWYFADFHQYTQNEIDVNHYRRHAIESDCGGSDARQAIRRFHLRSSRQRRYAQLTGCAYRGCAYKCEFCPESELGSPVEHSHPHDKEHFDKSRFELFIMCRECCCQVPIGDAIGHFTLWHHKVALQEPDSEEIADSFVTNALIQSGNDEEGSPQADTESAAPSETRHLAMSSQGKNLAGVRPTGWKRAHLFECDECGARFDDKSQMTRHWSSHTPVSNYRCGLCSACFRSGRSLTMHLAIGHRNEAKQAFPCPICADVFDEYRARDAHLRTAHKGQEHLTCKHCPAKFATQDHLHLHVLGEHTFEKLYRCKHCSEAFHRPHELRDHMSVHTGEPSPSRPRAPCPECDRVLCSPQRLQQHIASKHRNERHNCEECGKGFVLQSALVVHARRHTGERPFVCDQCGRGYRTKAVLAQHRRQYCSATRELKARQE